MNKLIQKYKTKYYMITHDTKLYLGLDIERVKKDVQEYYPQYYNYSNQNRFIVIEAETPKGECYLAAVFNRVTQTWILPKES